MKWIWKDRDSALKKSVDIKTTEYEVQKVKQNVTMRINVDIEYPHNVDVVNEITKADITFDLPKGISFMNAKMTNLELL